MVGCNVVFSRCVRDKERVIIAQVLMSGIGSAADAKCGVAINVNEDWTKDRTYSILVQGTIDARNDGEETRGIALSVVKFVGGVESCRTDFSTSTKVQYIYIYYIIYTWGQKFNVYYSRPLITWYLNLKDLLTKTGDNNGTNCIKIWPSFISRLHWYDGRLRRRSYQQP